MLILAVDPGTANTGYAVIEAANGQLKAIDYGVIKTPAGSPIAERLRAIHDHINLLFGRFRPDQFVVEQLFFNTNVRTAMAVGQARGVCLLAAAKAQVAATEYTPLEVKQAVVGYGRAEKSQVKEMVRIILRLDEAPKEPDAADALALAICHAHCSGNRAARAIELRGESKDARNVTAGGKQPGPK